MASEIPEIISALRYAHSRGAVIVAAAGNYKYPWQRRVAYPARAGDVIGPGVDFSLEETDIGFHSPDSEGIASFLLEGLDDSLDYYVVMTAYDGAANESVFSNEIVIAALANTIVKCGIAVALAGLTFARPLLLATAATVLVGLGAVYLM